MSEVIHRIDAPFVAEMVMRLMKYPVKRRIAHVYIGRRHIYFCTKRAAAIGKFAVFHAFEKIEVLFDAAVAVGTVDAGLGKCAAVFPNLIFVEITNVGLALFYEFNGQLIAGIKIIAAVADLIPFETEPADILFNCIDVFDIFLSWIGVVKAKITFSPEAFSSGKVYPQSFCVSDMKITVGFRWEPCHYGWICFSILNDEFFYKITGFEIAFHIMNLSLGKQKTLPFIISIVIMPLRT